MIDRGDMVALGAGLLVGGAVAAVFAYTKGKSLERRGVVLTRALEAQGSSVEAFLAVRGAEAQRIIAATGAREADVVAKRTAELYLERNFGITPQRIQAISRLGSAF